MPTLTTYPQEGQSNGILQMQSDTCLWLHAAEHRPGMLG